MSNKTTIQVLDQYKKIKEDSRADIQQKIGFLGGGNMASAILQGLKQRQELEFVVIEPVEEARLNLLAMLPDRVTLLSQPTKDLENCSILVLATKPQQLKSAFLSAIRFLKKPLVISVAAGITTQSIEAWWASVHNESVSVVRTMPNTPALVGQGMTGLFASKQVSEAQKTLANKMMSSIGKTLWVSCEGDLDMITALSGSGPAYFFWLMDQLVKQAVDLGFSPTQARSLVVQTALGAAILADKSSDSLEILKEKVTSKGGTTAAALNVFEQEKMGDSVKNAIIAAHIRSKELAQEFAESTV